MGVSRWLILVLISTTIPQCDAKDRDWQTGTLVSSREESSTISKVTTEQGNAPSVINGGTYNKQQESHEVDTVWQEYAIKAGGFGYVAKQDLPWRWSKPAVVTIGGPVRFALEGRNLYLVDERGKEYKMELLQRTVIPAKSKATSPNAKNDGSTKANGLPKSAAMTNADVRRLKEAGLSDALLIEKIKNSASTFNLETDDLLELNKAGISDLVITAMIQNQVVSK